MRRKPGLIVLAAAAALAAGLARGGNSGGYRGPRRNGIYPATGLMLWVSPTIAEGRLFVRHGSVLSVYDLRPAGAGARTE